jgi:hypothetical protein
VVETICGCGCSLSLLQLLSLSLSLQSEGAALPDAAAAFPPRLRLAAPFLRRSFLRLLRRSLASRDASTAAAASPSEPSPAATARDIATSSGTTTEPLRLPAGDGTITRRDDGDDDDDDGDGDGCHDGGSERKTGGEEEVVSSAEWELLVGLGGSAGVSARLRVVGGLSATTLRVELVVAGLEPFALRSRGGDLATGSLDVGRGESTTPMAADTAAAAAVSRLARTAGVGVVLLLLLC